jgi:hypothetical protein
MDAARKKELLEYIDRASETLNRLVGPVNQRGGWESKEEAEQIYSFAVRTIRDLEQIKREINQSMKDIRLSFDAQSPQKKRLFRAPVTRRDLEIQKRKALQPYEQAKTGIDSMLTSLEGIKTGAKQAIDAFGKG